jgi:hypothetical protein
MNGFERNVIVSLLVVVIGIQVGLIYQINDVSKDTARVLNRLSCQIQFQNTSTPIPSPTSTSTPTYTPSKTPFVSITTLKDKGKVS